MFFTANREECEKVKLPMSDKCMQVKYSREGRNVYFSFGLLGNAMECHIAAKGKSKLLLREAVNMFCDEIFLIFPSVEEITGSVIKKSVINLLKKCGFVSINEKLMDNHGKQELVTSMARFRNGVH